MGELLGHFRNRIPPVLIGDREWEHVLRCADGLRSQWARFRSVLNFRCMNTVPGGSGVSLTSGTEAARFFEQRARIDRTDGTAGALVRLFERMDAEFSPLREIVGRKVMLEFDIGRSPPPRVPGLFLRPGERPIVGAGGQLADVGTVADALVACVGWEMTAGERQNVERAYVMQPADTRMDSFGLFPSRSRALRLAIMGFRSRHDTGSYLEGIGWPGDVRAVEAVIERFRERANIVRSGDEYRRSGRRCRPDAGPDVDRQAAIHEGLPLLARRPDRLGSFPGCPAARGHRGSGKARRAWQLGCQAITALRQVRTVRDAARNSPHKAGHVRGPASTGQGVHIHRALGRGPAMTLVLAGRA